MKPLGVVAVLVVAVAVGWYLWAQHDSTFRYRLTVAVESGGKTYTGSGVIQVSMHYQDYWSPPALPHVTGDAVIVDVPGHDPMFVLLTARNNVDWDAAVAFETFQNRFPVPRTVRGDTRMLANARETATIPPERYPMLVAFHDIADPKSVYELSPDDLSPPLDPGARVVSMTIEMTGDGVTYAIEKRLPWLGKEVTAYLDGSHYRMAGRPFSNSIGISNFRKRGT